MLNALPPPAGQARQLAPFVLLSLALHAALLFFIHPPARNFSIRQPHPIEVYLNAPAVPEPTRIPIKAFSQKHVNPAKLPAPPKIPAALTVTQPEASSAAAAHQVFYSQQLMESAIKIVRDEAKKTEQQIAAQEKKKLNSPIGMLAQNLRQTGKEIRLANGMLKIVTDTGAVCFQPVPSFARDTPGLYGIPTTCP